MVKDTTIMCNSFVTPIERFPMLPTIFMDKMHPYNWNKYKKKSHDA